MYDLIQKSIFYMECLAKMGVYQLEEIELHGEDMYLPISELLKKIKEQVGDTKQEWTAWLIEMPYLGLPDVIHHHLMLCAMETGDEIYGWSEKFPMFSKIEREVFFGEKI